MLVPGFGRFKHTFKSSVEEFFSPKLLPVLSFSFLLVALSLAVTGKEDHNFCYVLLSFLIISSFIMCLLKFFTFFSISYFFSFSTLLSLNCFLLFYFVLIWSDLIWFDLIWFDLIWFDPFLFVWTSNLIFFVFIFLISNFVFIVINLRF